MAAASFPAPGLGYFLFTDNANSYLKTQNFRILVLLLVYVFLRFLYFLLSFFLHTMNLNSYPVLEMYDTPICERDISYLSNGQWLSDNLISFFLHDDHQAMGNNSDNIIIIDATVAVSLHFMCDDIDEKRQYCSSLSITNENKNNLHILIPINNTNGEESAGMGSHWSLLYINTSDKTYYCLDSSNNSNHSIALKFLDDILDMLSTEVIKNNDDKKYSRMKLSEITITNVLPQQHNAYDCGCFTILYAKRIIKNITTNNSNTDRINITNKAFWIGLDIDSQSFRNNAKMRLKELISLAQVKNTQG